MLEHNDIVLAGIIEIRLCHIATLSRVTLSDGKNLEMLGAFLFDVVAYPMQSLRSARIINAFLIITSFIVSDVGGSVREVREQSLQIHQSLTLNGVNAISTKDEMRIILNIALKNSRQRSQIILLRPR